MSIRNYSGSDEFANRLTLDVSDHMPVYERFVGLKHPEALSLSASPYYNSACGLATRYFGHALGVLEYDVAPMENKTLGKRSELYPIGYHSVLLVSDQDSTRQYVVDAAYLQFLRGLFLPEELRPEEVIVFQTDEVDIVASALVKIRERKIAHHMSPAILREKPLFQITDEELAAYFARIWNLEDYAPMEG